MDRFVKVSGTNLHSGKTENIQGTEDALIDPHNEQGSGSEKNHKNSDHDITHCMFPAWTHR